ncbi:hypothetical protein M3Y99_01204400 [Aphelenchoides fujianensis]|nr:hypothetical protein M3Y99_01204400 [Aphelenchoides fujianensis]
MRTAVVFCSLLVGIGVAAGDHVRIKANPASNSAQNPFDLQGAFKSRIRSLTLKSSSGCNCQKRSADHHRFSQLPLEPRKPLEIDEELLGELFRSSKRPAAGHRVKVGDKKLQENGTATSTTNDPNPVTTQPTTQPTTETTTNTPTQPTSASTATETSTEKTTPPSSTTTAVATTKAQQPGAGCPGCWCCFMQCSCGPPQPCPVPLTSTPVTPSAYQTTTAGYVVGQETSTAASYAPGPPFPPPPSSPPPPAWTPAYPTGAPCSHPPAPQQPEGCCSIPVQLPCFACPCLSQCAIVPLGECPCGVDTSYEYQCPYAYSTEVPISELPGKLDEGYRVPDTLRPPPNCAYGQGPSPGGQYAPPIPPYGPYQPDPAYFVPYDANAPVPLDGSPAANRPHRERPLPIGGYAQPLPHYPPGPQRPYDVQPPAYAQPLNETTSTTTPASSSSKLLPASISLLFVFFSLLFCSS